MGSVRALAGTSHAMAVGKNKRLTKGTKIASEGLKGRLLEVSLGDLNKNEDDAYRKMMLRVEDVQGKNVLTNFHGMDFTTDKLRSLVRKWQSLSRTCTSVRSRSSSHPSSMPRSSPRSTL